MKIDLRNLKSWMNLIFFYGAMTSNHMYRCIYASSLI